MIFDRESGILLHPSSLPAKYGIGDLGEEAYDFIDFLQGAKQRLWQILPLNPPGYGESPFQCYSAFAGNPLLISPDRLWAAGLLLKDDLQEVPEFCESRVQFALVREYKERLLRKAYQNFKRKKKDSGYEEFIFEASWLKDFTLFMALKNYFKGLPWNQWESSIALREERAMAHYRTLLAEEIAYHGFVQFIFFTQWLNLKKYANSREIKIIGDLPIFVSYDSSDAWAHPRLFELDEQGNPAKVAGVPPDYFSETGQLWGNPLYRWEEMEKDGYRWWRERFNSLLKTVDIVRLDHFRGFEAYWEIAAGQPTAVQGRWVKGPGEKFFRTMMKHLGDMPVIAEDLGLITPEVYELKDQFHFPGMKVLQFHLHSSEKELYLPHHYESNTVVYTGTHDNDTTLGWYKGLLLEDPQEAAFLHQYLKEYLDGVTTFPENICWQMIEVAFSTAANTVIIPLQDILCLDSDARMNFPGTVGGNWEWRLRPGSLTPELQERLARLSVLYNRNNGTQI
ncbi:4-alpha-glucanotransferase [Desulforamulus ruminis]|uniref:4-alpha-glucanotransferase n=2 Tax=Desulforamulus ruminis TaxID=1564 RepID=F6DPX1_DESRL|nr:4-alpha-glucanotransferase [Desulforamulus ruminis DSM 2154]